jgi:hypothetical protein
VPLPPPHDEFIIIDGTSGDHGSKNMTKIKLLSGERIKFNNFDFAYDNGYSASVMWDSKSPSSSKEIPFTFHSLIRATS